MESGNAIINQKAAKWVKYKSINNHIRTISIEYFYYDNGHLFFLLASFIEPLFDQRFQVIEIMILGFKNHPKNHTPTE